MRIGIITFHRAINYGAVLQTYALQKFLNVSNYDAEVIDYRCEHMENFYKTFTIKDKSVKQIIRGMLNFKNTYKKKREFYRFLDQNVRISTEVYDKFNIDKHSFCVFKAGEWWTSKGYEFGLSIYSRKILYLARFR